MRLLINAKVGTRFMNIVSKEERKHIKPIMQ